MGSSRILMLAALGAAALTAAPLGPVDAQLLQSGDILVAATYNTEYVIWRFRGGTRTPLFPGGIYSPVYGVHEDLMMDKQGRPVFIAHSPATSVTYCGLALFRGDPATGSVERLFQLLQTPQPDDTIPEGMPAGLHDFCGYNQSLHLTRSYGLKIDDDVNGGLPQVWAEDAYEFAVVAKGPANEPRHIALRYRPSSGVIEVGASLKPLDAYNGNPAAMAADGSDIYFGWGSRIYKAGRDARLSFHFNVGGVTVDALGQVVAPPALLTDAWAVDNTLVANNTWTCATGGTQITDTDVPDEGGGFYSFGMDRFGILGGKIYATGASVSTGYPYLFDVRRRADYLNPYVCVYFPALEVSAPYHFFDPIFGSPCYRTTPDGSRLLGVQYQAGRLLSIDPSGSASVLEENIPPYLGGVAVVGAGASAAAALASSGAATEPAASALVVRADGPVRVLVRDSQGRRIGQDADGTEINDFAEAGSTLILGPGGESHVASVMSPVAGNYYLEITGTADGPYTLTGYLAETSTGGSKSAITGTAQTGVTESRAFTVALPLTLTWVPGSVGVPGGSGPHALEFAAVFPTPSPGDVRFEYRVPEPGGHVRLQIYDLLGRRVSSLVDEHRGAGTWHNAWNGEDATGRQLRAGVFLAQLSMDGQAPVVRRIVLER